jgi:hypothetical protein
LTEETHLTQTDLALSAMTTVATAVIPAISTLYICVSQSTSGQAVTTDKDWVLEQPGIIVSAIPPRNTSRGMALPGTSAMTNQSKVLF